MILVLVHKKKKKSAIYWSCASVKCDHSQRQRRKSRSRGARITARARALRRTRGSKFLLTLSTWPKHFTRLLLEWSAWQPWRHSHKKGFNGVGRFGYIFLENGKDFVPDIIKKKQQSRYKKNVKCKKKKKSVCFLPFSQAVFGINLYSDYISFWHYCDALMQVRCNTITFTSFSKHLWAS